MDKVWIAEVRDGADFNALLERKAALTREDARAWGESVVSWRQCCLRAEGETDQAFIDAIECVVYSVEMV